MSAITEISEDESGEPFTAKSYLEYLRPSNSHWWVGNGNIESCPWVFRGHASASGEWKLIPSAFRNKCINALSPLISHFESIPIVESHSHKHNAMTNHEKGYLYNSLAYGQAMYDFLTTSYDHGLLDFHRFNNFVQDLKGSKSIGMDPNTDYFQCHTDFCGEENKLRIIREYYEVAQHYRLPTHLLDWSKSPLYAAHFATDSWLDYQDKTNIAVWAMKEFDSLGIPECGCDVIMFSPSVLNNMNAKAQLGRFTVVKREGARQYFHQHGSYPALEDLFSKVDPSNCQIEKIVLSSEHVPELRTLLDREGITQAKLMPGFDSVVSTIKSSWKNL